MKTTALFLAAAGFCSASEEVEYRRVMIPKDVIRPIVWKSEIPEDCPFEQSELFNRIYFTGRHSDYNCGDTFYPSWASDDNLYSPWTDGWTDGIESSSYRDGGESATTGQAVMIGDDPLNLVITNTSPPVLASAKPYSGRYPAGSLVHDGIWYYSTYCLGPGGGYTHNGFKYNWPNLGPMPGFRISYDLGKTWVDSPHTPEKPLFPEPAEYLAPVKMGAPHIVDFGKNMEHSPDGKVYMLGMGAEADDPEPRPCAVVGEAGEAYRICEECPGDEEKHFAHANLSWVTADQVYMARVTPSPETINDEGAYEYFGGHDADGNPVWTDDFKKIQPLLEWNNNMGCVTATYVPQLKKYLMCVTDGWPTVAKMDSYILEADEITGPWRIITYLKDFGEQAYFLNVPTKFIGDDGKTMWLCYSANFSPGWNGVKLGFNPFGGRYGLCLHEMQFLSKEEKDPVIPVVEVVDIFAGNIAPDAERTVSTTYNHTGASEGLTDEMVGGWPVRSPAEWVTHGEREGASAKLQWKEPHTVNRVLLFDRPNTSDHILAGKLTFSDGVSILIDKPLPNSAEAGLAVKFEARTVEWIKFTVTKVSDQTSNVGLSEFAVFEAK